MKSITLVEIADLGGGTSKYMCDYLGAEVTIYSKHQTKSMFTEENEYIEAMSLTMYRGIINSSDPTFNSALICGVGYSKSSGMYFQHGKEFHIQAMLEAMKDDPVAFCIQNILKLNRSKKVDKISSKSSFSEKPDRNAFIS